MDTPIQAGSVEPHKQTMPNKALDSMPVELLESIASWLAPRYRMSESCNESSCMLYNIDDSMKQYTLKRSNKAMRLVCKTFSRLHAVNSGLFQNLHVTPSSSSLARITEVSKHEGIRMFVKHITFGTPRMPKAFSIQQFEHELRDRLIYGYEGNLKYHQDQKVRNKSLPLLEEDLAIELAEPEDHIFPAREERARFLARKYFDVVFPSAERNDYYTKILTAIEQQRVLCEKGGFAMQCGDALARLVNATSISLAKGAGETVISMITAFVYVDTFAMHLTTRDYADKSWKTTFMQLVLDVLAASKTKVSHLYTDGYGVQISRLTRLPDEMSPHQFSNLQTVRLELNDDKPYPWTQESWLSYLHPMLSSCSKTLKSLALKRSRRVGCYDASPPVQIASLDQLLSITFLALRRLEFIGAFMMTAVNISEFLIRHPQLQEIHMPFQEHEIDEGREGWRPDDWWVAFFKTVRYHPGLKVRAVRMYFMRDDFPSGGEEPVAYPTEHAPPWCYDLDAYLNSQGVWTDALVEKYGLMA